MKLTAVSVALASITLVAASNQAGACDIRHYLVKDIQFVQQSGDTELAFVLTASKEEFNRAKQNAGADVFGLFSLSYNDAKEKALQLSQSVKFNYQRSYAYSYFSQTVDPTAINAYIQCLDKDNARNTPGLHLWLQQRQGNYFTFSGFWVGDDTSVQRGNYDSKPIFDNVTLISEPDYWKKGVTENIVVKRKKNKDFYINLKVGGQEKTIVIVKDPLPIIWEERRVISDVLMKVQTWGPNPGCSAGEQSDCIYALDPGSSFVPNTAAIIDGYSSSPVKYSEDFYIKSPKQICVRITQGTGCCECVEHAQGRLSAIESFPQAGN